MAKDYSGTATVCQVLSAIAIPLLLYFGYLAHSESPLLEIPVAKKKDAAIGCWGAAVLYCVTLVASIAYKQTRVPVTAPNPNDYHMRGFA